MDVASVAVEPRAVAVAFLVCQVEEAEMKLVVEIHWDEAS